MSKNNNLGRDSNTILTNRSKYMTVVTNEPYTRRKCQRFGLGETESTQKPDKQVEYKRGLRPLHKTTLSFETLPFSNNYVSTSKESFRGRHDVARCEPPTRCPSLHTSQFKVGMNSRHNMVTTSQKSFADYTTNSVHAIHEDRTRWRHQMSGKNMLNSTRYSNQIDFGTTYARNHHQFPSQKPDNELKCTSSPWRSSVYNIINGEQKTATTVMFNSTSGDRVLHNARTREPPTSLLCS